MPKKKEWIKSLLTKRQVTIDSSLVLANKVSKLKKSKSFRGTPKTITCHAKFQTPQIINIAPIEVLMAVGRLTTPKVRNLVDLASTWAYRRYIWAFNPDKRIHNLILSNHVRNLDTHQKAVLSDDLGVGICGLIVGKYFAGKKPVPVSLALRKSLIPRMKKTYQTEPDYIFQQKGGGYIVAECKGTTLNMKSSLQQLRRGSEQVPSIVIPGSSPLSLVVGACLMQKQTKINIIDPPDENNVPEASNRIIVENIERLNEDIDGVHLASLLWYCGENQMANEILEARELLSDSERTQMNYSRATIKLDLLGQPFTGVYSPPFLLGPGITAKIFQGVRVPSNNRIDPQYLLDEDNLQMEFEKAKFSLDMNPDNDSPSENTAEENNSDIIIFETREEKTIRAHALSQDGAIFFVEIE